MASPAQPFDSVASGPPSSGVDVRGSWERPRLRELWRELGILFLATFVFRFAFTFIPHGTYVVGQAPAPRDWWLMMTWLLLPAVLCGALGRWLLARRSRFLFHRYLVPGLVVVASGFAMVGPMIVINATTSDAEMTAQHEAYLLRVDADTRVELEQRWVSADHMRVMSTLGFLAANLLFSPLILLGAACGGLLWWAASALGGRMQRSP